MRYKIPIYQPLLAGNELKYLNECIKSNFISSKGKFLSPFEKKFAEYIGVKHATSCCNGSCALHLAISSLDIGYGDEVILPTLTFIASANSVVNNGAVPVLVDVTPDWQINPDEVRKKITKKTKAILAVHLYGYPCNLDELMKISKEYNIPLIEDCAESFGSYYKGKHVGSFGKVSIFSFYGNKTITTGEGGMIVTNNFRLFKKINNLKTHGTTRGDKFFFVSTGFNFKMTNLSAALGLAQLENVEKIILRKRKIEVIYRKYLEKFPITFHSNNKDNFYWLVTVLVENESIRNRLRKFLEANDIETRPFFYPLHLLPMFRKRNLKCPIAENIALRGISLPSYPSLKNKEIEFICNKIGEFYGITKLN